ncbi:MAG: hypothetical protein G01um101472_287 [Parcubacteria group bacterium Gr01-1014_72]|nr:MAG: hypothetical protein G01um101472_287 [Parcubacteria group bacterium Gr01-1014_72]
MFSSVYTSRIMFRKTPFNIGRIANVNFFRLFGSREYKLSTYQFGIAGRPIRSDGRASLAKFTL